MPKKKASDAANVDDGYEDFLSLEGEGDDDSGDDDSTSQDSDTSGDVGSSDDGSSDGSAPDDRLRDLMFKEFKKRDERMDSMQNLLASGFGEIKGMLAERQQTNGGSGNQTQNDSEPELTDEQINEYIQAGRGPEVYRYMAQREARKITQQENERYRRMNREETALTAGTQALYREFPELNNGVHPFTQKTNEIYNSMAVNYGGAEVIKGTPLQLELAGRAAERAARLHGDLRDQARRRDRVSRNQSDASHVTDGGITVGRGKPKSGDLPALSREDAGVAFDWGINIADDATAKKIREHKKYYEDRLLEMPHSADEFGKI